MSPLEEMIADYFEALETRDYPTARANLININQSTTNPRVIEDLIRRTYELVPQ